MKTITGEEDFITPILFLITCSMLLGLESSHLYENMRQVGSIILTEPILFADSFFATISNFLIFLFPVVLFIIALKQNSILLKTTYILGAVPFIFTKSVIMKLGYKSLFALKIAILFIVAMLLMKYLIRITELYKAKLKQNNG